MARSGSGVRPGTAPAQLRATANNQGRPPSAGALDSSGGDAAERGRNVQLMARALALHAMGRKSEPLHMALGMRNIAGAGLFTGKRLPQGVEDWGQPVGRRVFVRGGCLPYTGLVCWLPPPPQAPVWLLVSSA
jgi:hypothetical protein